MSDSGRAVESRAAARDGADTAGSATPLPRPGLGTYTYDPTPAEILDTIEAEVRGARGKYKDFQSGHTGAVGAVFALRDIDSALAYVIAKVDELRSKLP